MLPKKRNAYSKKIYVKKKKKQGKTKERHNRKKNAKKTHTGKKHHIHGIKKQFPLTFDKVLGVERLLVPFNKFYMKQESENIKPDKMTSYKTCLTSKEKNYLICNCQKRTSKYARLKSLASEAQKKNKVFLINGNSNSIRKALVERGWVEKIPPHRMDLSTIRNKKFVDDTEMHNALERLLLSNLVEKSLPGFIWNLQDGWENENLINSHKVIHNRIKMGGLWTTKQGLCSSVRDNHWNYIEGVAEFNSPRTYNCANTGDKEEFENDYKLTACTSLLKWVLSMVNQDRPIFVESGTISINVIVFALNRCKEFLFQKQNKDIDKITVANTTNGQWNAFLKKFYLIISKKETFVLDKENKLPLYLGYAKFMLKEIHKYRPQLSCEGCHNIWIIKPAHCSRGRGIRMASKLAVLMELSTKGKYVFQKYIEESLLIHETKFDIRQYYLVTSTYPLVIWMYQDCYLKFSSQKYNLKNYHESIHLTNNAVQRKYKNCTDRHPELPHHNMWNLNTFKEHLTKVGKETIWDSIIYPGMKKTIVGIMLSCQESASKWKNRFELYGCDFILDKNYKPWLIEINSGPDLNPTTKVTAEICPAVLEDVIKVVVDHTNNSKGSTGKFECVYRQNFFMRPCNAAADLFVQGHSLPNNYFFKGDLLKDDCYDNTEEQDVAAVLARLKSNYNSNKSNLSDFMHKPKSPTKPCLQNSVHDNNVNGGHTVITEQVDDMFDHITSDVSPSSEEKNLKISPSISSSPSSINFREENMHKNFNASDTDINSLVAKPVSRFASVTALNIFKFSELDDGPLGKGSGLLCPVLNSSFQVDKKLSDFSIKIDKINITENKDANIKPKTLTVNDEKGHADTTDEYLKVTKKIFSFLNRKQDEYLADTFSR